MATPAFGSALGAVSQAFTTSDGSLVAGTIVSLKSGSAQVIEESVSSKSSQLLGVTADTPLLELGGGTQKAQVVVSGLTSVLVSTINGDIKVGDKITASPIQGIGMKALDSTEIVGTAQSNLDNDRTTSKSIVDKNGKQDEVKIGTVAVQVNVAYYAANNPKINQYVPTFLVNAGSSIAGKDVSPIRILIGFFVLLIGFMIAAVLLQSGVRSGMISLGRNPLASGILRRSIVDVLVTSIGLLGITGIVFYIVLTT